jgi:ectoine hydroxylase-related dioxygenase (phytanoyl-CoA dioxygenase family)
MNRVIFDIVKGPGYHIIRQAVDKEIVDACLKYVRRATNSVDDNVLERRVWNLHERKNYFHNIAFHPTVVDTYNSILGTKHKLASFGANRMMPGAQAQESHTDYPYWGLARPETLPMGLDNSFALACQSLVALQDFTSDNGATEVVPFSQLFGKYPDHTFDNGKIQLDLKAGDLVLYHSMLWHRAGHNKSDTDRCVLLGQYTAYFIKDMM